MNKRLAFGSLERRAVPFVALVGTCLLAGLLATVGCSRQPEGERCSLLNGDADCDGELVCTAASSLSNGSDGVSRCCPQGNTFDDQRCQPRLGGGTGGSNGSGGDGLGGFGGDDTGAGASSGIGDACQYTSECLSPLECGPTGFCQPECQGDRDCPAGQVCSAEQACVSGAGGASN